MPAELTPDFPLFLGGMLAGICGAVAALVSVLALPGSPVVAFTYGFGVLGLAFLAVGIAAAVAFWFRRERRLISTLRVRVRQSARRFRHGL